MSKATWAALLAGCAVYWAAVVLVGVLAIRRRAKGAGQPEAFEVHPASGNAQLVRLSSSETIRIRRWLLVLLGPPLAVIALRLALG